MLLTLVFRCPHLVCKLSTAAAVWEGPHWPLWQRVEGTPWLSKRRALLLITFLVIVASSNRVGENRRWTGKRREVSVSDSNDFQSPRCKNGVQIWISGCFWELAESWSFGGTQSGREGMGVASSSSPTRGLRTGHCLPAHHPYEVVPLT